MSTIVTINNFNLKTFILNTDGNTEFQFNATFVIETDKLIPIEGEGHTDHALKETDVYEMISQTTEEELLDKIETMEYGVYMLDTFFWIDYQWMNNTIKIIYKMI